jgi:hypothetical protein
LSLDSQRITLESQFSRAPDNLESLHKEEEKIRTEALLAIKADSALKEHLDMIHASLLRLPSE